MKKFMEKRFSARKVLKCVLIMKMAWLFLVLTALQLTAGNTLSYSQSAKLNLRLENASLEKVIWNIQKKTEFNFFYNSRDVKRVKNVSVNFSNATAGEILSAVLKGTGLTYEIVHKTVIIREAPQSPPPPADAPPEEELQQPEKKSLSGVVTDTDNMPMPGVTVIVKGTTMGTITDADGEFSISVPLDARTLQFSFVGMKTQEVAIGNQTEFRVTMEPESIGLEEVVAVGYGTQKRVNLTGSVATVDSEKLTVAPVASTTNALAGRLPGLIAKQESGLPGGDAARLSIRGFDSPLVIVDGVETSFNNIDASEIESISVLKDASAAIYGARAGNGVILVTTKRGTVGKPTIKLHSNYTIQGATHLPELASSGQMAELAREEHLNAGRPESTIRFTEEEVQKFYEGTDPDYPNTDWKEVVMRDWAPQHQHNLSVRGGSDKIKYYGFLGYLDQQSMFKKNGGEYQRYNIRSNIDAEITEKFNVQFDLSTIVEDRDFPHRSDERENSVWQEYWTTEPYWHSELPDETKFPYGGAGGAVGLHAMTNSEVIGYRRSDTQNLKGTLSGTYDFSLEGLSAKAFVNYERNYSFWKQWDWLVDSYSYNYSNDTYTQRTTKSNRGLTYSDSKNRTITAQASLNYDNIFAEDHHVSALALYEMIDYRGNWVSSFRDGQKTFALDYAFAGSLANQRVNDGASEMGRTSYIGRVNYAYKSKYLLESTLRVDKSAKFSSEERTGIFPSVSAGWRISEENFLKDNLPALDNLKLRGSFSQTGNDAVGNFQYLAGYQYGETYLMGSNATAGLVATGLANPLLTWEEMSIYNAGLDFSVKNSMVYGELDLFYRDRDGIPGRRVVSLPSTFGATLPVENLNSITTRGFEFSLGTQGNWRDLRWDVSGNVSWARSKWDYFDEPEYEDPDEKRLNQRTGKWTDINYGFKSDGLFTSVEEIEALEFVYDETQGNAAIKPGDVRYIDKNDDGLLNWRDQVEIGKGTMPHWMVGMSMNVNYKNFDMQALFQGALGFTQKVALNWGTNYSLLMYNERWTPENNHKDGLIPRLGGANTNNWASDFNYKNSDYLRLKTFSLGYNLPGPLMQKAGFENVRVYVAGTNVFTISQMNKYDIDPEGQSGYGGYYYPQMRTFTFGLNLSL